MTEILGISAQGWHLGAAAGQVEGLALTQPSGVKDSECPSYEASPF